MRRERLWPHGKGVLKLGYARPSPALRRHPRDDGGRRLHDGVGNVDVLDLRRASIMITDRPGFAVLKQKSLDHQRRGGGDAVKMAEVRLLVVAIAGIGLTAALVPNTPAPAALPQAEPTGQKHSQGAPHTPSPAEPRQARSGNRAETAEWQRQQDEDEGEIGRRIARARVRPRSIRLPPDYRWGRCLLVVQGKTRISGACAYSLKKEGEFRIEGPRQIYGGIDFPKPTHGYEEASNDYWAELVREEPSWTGFGNTNIGDTHVSGPWFGPLRRQGACWVSKIARICLWK
jgi:hypothetical protein